MSFSSPGRSLLLTAVAAAVFSMVVPGKLVLAAGSKHRDPSIEIRFHVQVPAFDPTFATKINVGNPPKELVVEKIPTLSERDFAAFYPYRAADGTYSAVFKLDRHGEATLEALSAERRGSLLVVVVNGRPVNSLLIDRIIKDGVIFVPAGLSEANIRALGASFSIIGEPEGGLKQRQKADRSNAAAADPSVR